MRCGNSCIVARPMAQKTGRCGSRICWGWNLLFIHAVDREEKSVELDQKTFASPFPFSDDMDARMTGHESEKLITLGNSDTEPTI
jgi:hypothetical protein